MNRQQRLLTIAMGSLAVSTSVVVLLLSAVYRQLEIQKKPFYFGKTRTRDTLGYGY